MRHLMCLENSWLNVERRWGRFPRDSNCGWWDFRGLGTWVSANLLKLYVFGPWMSAGYVHIQCWAVVGQQIASSKAPAVDVGYFPGKAPQKYTYPGRGLCSKH